MHAVKGLSNAAWVQANKRFLVQLPEDIFLYDVAQTFDIFILAVVLIFVCWVFFHKCAKLMTVV